MGNSITKAQVSKMARTVLQSHRADLSEIQIVASPRSVNLYGMLIKPDGSDFTVEAVMAISDSLTKIVSLTTHLSNWDMNGGVRKIERDE